MPTINTAIVRRFVVLDSTTFLPKTGLLTGSFTLELTVSDGVVESNIGLHSVTVTEVGNGVYSIPITANQNNHESCTIRGIVTGGIVIVTGWDNQVAIDSIAGSGKGNDLKGMINRVVQKYPAKS